MAAALFTRERAEFHDRLLREGILTVDSEGVPSNADKSQDFSKKVAIGLVSQLGEARVIGRAAGQTSGDLFEKEVRSFIEATFLKLGHLRPGAWDVLRVSSRQSTLEIAKFEQYAHLKDLKDAADKDRALATALGEGYIISPDLVIVRNPESDASINKPENLVDEGAAKLSSLRAANKGNPILHATISCKWSIRSDRAQNSRTEALNLIRYRKGRTPHIAIVTAEPTPSRIASVALGTGDIDCDYHFALYELQKVLGGSKYPDAKMLLDSMVDGKRLKDISDLPLDLAV